DSLEDFFKKQKLNQAPESRSVVFDKLVELMKALNGPVSFNDITKTLRDSMKGELSLGRKQISEILNCLRYFDLFRDKKNKPVKNTSELIYSMASLKPKTFERKCMEFYVEKVLQLFDPDFFDDKENIKIFERLTLGTVPSSEKIESMKERREYAQSSDISNDD
ncbi:MAG: hypothetical protein F6J97_24830, partial [Leptolyngbya sp. SIO4C1]|nr:hypothetical protein [Leptolyngbya sp. SIO4C1]